MSSETDDQMLFAPKKNHNCNEKLNDDFDKALQGLERVKSNDTLEELRFSPKKFAEDLNQGPDFREKVKELTNSIIDKFETK